MLQKQPPLHTNTHTLHYAHTYYKYTTINLKTARNKFG